MVESESSNPLRWSSRLRSEMAQFPETAANVRETAENLRKVSEQLIDVSEVLTRIVRVMESTGFTENLEQVGKLSQGVGQARTLLTPPASPSEVIERLSEMERAVHNLGRRMLGLSDTDDDPATGVE